MATQCKPKVGGSFTTITTTATGLCAKSSTTISGLAPGPQHAALRAVNEWHNATANTTTAARAQKIAGAAGITLQEV